MERLKVAVVSDALYPWHKGGKEIRYLHLLEGLPEHEMDVVVYSMKWWDDAPGILSSESGSLTYCAICPRVRMYHGAKRSMFQALLFAVSTFRLLTREFDVIEADHMPYLQLLPLRVVAWLKRVPLVITWHEVWGRDGWRLYIGRLGFTAAIVERICIRLPDRIVAVSAGTAEKLVVMGANFDHISVVPNPIDLDEVLASIADSAAPDLLFVGRLIEHKQANLAIEATQLLTARGFDIRLGVVGVGPEEARLRAQVVELGLDAHVTFYSSIDSQLDVWSLIQGSRVLLAPSIREGYGLVVAESLALGTPVVCVVHPDNEATKLISPTIGSIVEPFSAQALADAAEFWLNDQSQRTARTSTFLAENRTLTSSAMSTSYAEILRSVTRRQ